MRLRGLLVPACRWGGAGGLSKNKAAPEDPKRGVERVVGFRWKISRGGGGLGGHLFTQRLGSAISTAAKSDTAEKVDQTSLCQHLSQQ